MMEEAKEGYNSVREGHGGDDGSNSAAPAVLSSSAGHSTALIEVKKGGAGTESGHHDRDLHLHSHHHHSDHRNNNTDDEGRAVVNEEALQRKRNKQKVQKRERQWQTVGSSSSDSDHDRHGSIPGSENDSSSDGHSSDGSSEDSGLKKHKKHKKEHKFDSKKNHKHHKKDSKKSHKHSKKSHKHSKKDPKSTVSGNNLTVNQNDFGKYGILREENFHSKQREFEAYMSEVKHIPGVLLLGKREVFSNCFLLRTNSFKTHEYESVSTHSSLLLNLLFADYAAL